MAQTPGVVPRGHSVAKKAIVNSRSLKRKRHVEEHLSLDQAVEQDLSAQLEKITDLPLSQPTTLGLEASHFRALTSIQARAIPLALQGRDILGAARTGSGKTLAFLVPVLENLYRKQWTEFDGLGALIISPTRELAMQIFEVLRKIGRHHSFSAGLVIGGRSLQDERERLGRMNILVCTPGRMLQHMDQTAAFDIYNLQMLVLDEADRIMDMGFQAAVDAIVEHLPKTKQTLLFSATQTKKVSDLARLSLVDPEYISVHEAADSATPTTLQQHYCLTPLSQKLNALYSFLRSNLKSKIIVFLSSGKQVRFVYECLRRIQPGIPLLHLHGRQKQTARVDITTRFAASKNSCILATDVVARGLDFPAVDWVIQMDCPEDADTYIHRVGRTARFEKLGRAVLFLDPSEEEGFVRCLEHKNVAIEKINIRAGKQQDIQSQLQNMCFQDPELKYLGQKAFASYTRSIFVQKDKAIFNVSNYDLQAYAASLGLPGAPRIRFQKGDDVKSLKNAPRGMDDSSEDDDRRADGEAKKTTVRTRYDRMFERRNQDVLSEHYSKMIAGEEASNCQALDEEDADFLSVKRTIPAESTTHIDDTTLAPADHTKVIEGITKEPLVIDSKRREKLLKSKKKLTRLKDKGTKLVFDDAGVAHPLYELGDEITFAEGGAPEEQKARFLSAEGDRIREADVLDKQLAKEKKRALKEKRKAREQKDMDHVDAPSGPQLAVLSDGDEDPLALLASLPIAGEDASESERSTKRAKKWFEKPRAALRNAQDAAEEDERANRPQTLEQLEAMAADLLR